MPSTTIRPEAVQLEPSINTVDGHGRRFTAGTIAGRLIFHFDDNKDRSPRSERTYGLHLMLDGVSDIVPVPAELMPDPIGNRAESVLDVLHDDNAASFLLSETLAMESERTPQ